MSAFLRCTVSDDREDRLDMQVDVVSSTLFALGATAVGEETPSPRARVLAAGFVSIDAATEAARSLCGLHPDSVRDVVTGTEQADWAVAQRSGLEPSQIGPWQVRAPWDTANPEFPAHNDIIIDPGEAFGHGGHPTTALAIELLLRVARSGAHAVDIGTGTGVIAIIAARLGLTVDAIESDPIAVEVARSNIARNSTGAAVAVDRSIVLHEGDARAIVQNVGTSSVAIANVTLDVQRDLAPLLSSTPTVITSGILCRQVSETLGMYPDHEARTIRTHGEWASVLLRHPKRLADRSNR